jgi:hypothetical protein
VRLAEILVSCRDFFMAQYGLQGSITQIGVVTSGVPTSIQRQILATHKEPFLFSGAVGDRKSGYAGLSGVAPRGGRYADLVPISIFCMFWLNR